MLKASVSGQLAVYGLAKIQNFKNGHAFLTNAVDNPYFKEKSGFDALRKMHSPYYTFLHLNAPPWRGAGRTLT